MQQTTNINAGNLSGANAPVRFDRLPEMSITEIVLVISPVLTTSVVYMIFHNLHITEVKHGPMAIVLLVACTFSFLTFGIAWMRRRRSSGFYRIKACDLNRIINQNCLTGSQPCNVPLLANAVAERGSMKNTIKTSLLDGYVNFCISASRGILKLSRVRMKQVFHEDVPAAKGLTDEWAYELEQENDPVKRAIDATYMMKSACRISIRYGLIGRALQRHSKNRCGCGVPEDQCDGHRHADNDRETTEYF